MSIKSDIIAILEQNRDNPTSGEAIANQLEVSRAYVWKTIKKLKEEGYKIEATQNRGYILSSNNDIISIEGIQPFLLPQYQDLSIEVYKSIDSTNTEAKKRAVSFASHGSVIISEEQTAGRGRRGRSFFSPKGLGIYMSFILRPDVNSQDSVLITTATSVAVSRAIEKVTGIKCQIKWVNDLYYQNKKVCGILTEAVSNFETGEIDSIILGIGVNFCFDTDTLPNDLKDIAGSLYTTKPESVTRNMLCAHIINEVMTICDHLNERVFLTEYKEKSMVLGKMVYVIGQDDKVPALAMDLDSSGGLIVRFESGEVKTLNSGEISIRPINK